MAALVGGLALVAADPAVARADAPGPTDYQSEIVEVDPPVEGIETVMIGGDSFLQLTADPGVEVSVVGYQGEPYLRILADGTVEENVRSPSRYLNEDRFGETRIPPEADAEAEPEWITVDDDGSWAWHDHRTHWMNPGRPLGAGPGDQILEAVVPIEVDGRPVSLTVVSVWQPAPSRVWPVLGAVAGLALFVGLWRWRGALAAVLVTGGVVGVAALVVGAAQVLSLPPETGPSRLLWLLPLAVVVPVAVAAVVARNEAKRPIAAALGALAGVELAIWGWLRRDGITRAILPTDAPFDLDRAVTVAALVAGALTAATAVWLVLGPVDLDDEPSAT